MDSRTMFRATKFKRLTTYLAAGVGLGSVFCASSQAAPPPSLPAGAPIPSICQQARNEMRAAGPAAGALSIRFSFQDDPNKMMNDLQQHPYPPDNPHLQQVMVHCVQCMYHMNKRQFQSYILWGHP